MNKGPVTLDHIAAQLERALRDISKQQKQLTRMAKQLGELDEKLRHVIHRLPDDYHAARDPQPSDEDDGDPSHLYLDSDDD